LGNQAALDVIEIVCNKWKLLGPLFDGHVDKESAPEISQPGG